MSTFTAFTKLTSKQAAKGIGLAMERLEPEPSGVGVFEMEDGSGLWEVGGYFTEAPDETGLSILAAAFDAQPFLISELPETDWVAKVRRDLAPVEAGRFFLYGSHDADKVPEGKITLLIEAAMAFGTGHHGTTKGCLLALDKLLEAGLKCKNVIDVGCGTAVLAMAAASVWLHPVIASDIDQVAVDVALANVAANALGDKVNCYVARGFEHVAIEKAAPFDLVFANILKGPLIELAPHMAANTAQGGQAILSGLLIEQAADVIAAYRASGFDLSEQIDIEEWSTLILQKI